MRRRRPLDIPYAEAAAELGALVSGHHVSPPDAGAFVDAVHYHGLTGYAVEATGCGRLVLPPEEARRLADTQARRLLHAALLRRELAAAVASLRTIGVSPLLVKGPAVANRYYRDPALRTFAELDLLVPRRRLAGGVAALAQAGYSIAGDYRPTTRSRSITTSTSSAPSAATASTSTCTGASATIRSRSGLTTASSPGAPRPSTSAALPSPCRRSPSSCSPSPCTS